MHYQTNEECLCQTCRSNAGPIVLVASPDGELEKFCSTDTQIQHTTQHKPSLMKTLARVFLPKFLQATILKLFHDVLIFVVPQLLK